MVVALVAVMVVMAAVIVALVGVVGMVFPEVAEGGGGIAVALSLSASSCSAVVFVAGPVAGVIGGTSCWGGYGCMCG